LDGPDEAVRELVRQVAFEAGIVRGSHVCDVGCGYGATARMLESEYGAEVVGLLEFIRTNPSSDFARSVFRIWAAYECGALRFGLFSSMWPA